MHWFKLAGPIRQKTEPVTTNRQTGGCWHTATYLCHYTLKREEDWWAVEELYSLIRVNIVEAWEITRILVNTASSDEALAYVAAGPLEDLLKSQSIRKRQLEGSSVAVRRGYGM
jgi:hypothetical protein